MTLPADVLDRDAGEAVRLLALELLAAARGAADRLENPADGAAVHAFRVALRRLRSVLDAFAADIEGSVRRRDVKALEGLQRRTGDGRDAEVALAWIAALDRDLSATERRGVRALAKRLEARRDAGRLHARDEVRHRFKSLADRLEEGLRVLVVRRDLLAPAAPTPFAARLASRLREGLAVAAVRLERVQDQGQRRKIHRARIAVKRLRSLIEPLGAAAPLAAEAAAGLKRFQRLFGELNDAHVLLRHLPEASRSAGVKRLRALDERRIARLYAEFDAARRRGEVQALLERLRTFEERLAAAGSAGVEVERKFLLKGLPLEAARGEAVEIDQGWLPGQRLRERVRRVRWIGRARSDRPDRPDGPDETHGPDGGGAEVVRYYRTVKLGAGISRFELEEETTREVFEVLWPLTEGCRVRKRRHLVDDGGRLWELDEFLDRELVLAEVELGEARDEVAVPDWLGSSVVREVTGDPAFVNLNLAR